MTNGYKLKLVKFENVFISLRVKARTGASPSGRPQFRTKKGGSGLGCTGFPASRIIRPISYPVSGRRPDMASPITGYDPVFKVKKGHKNVLKLENANLMLVIVTYKVNL